MSSSYSGPTEFPWAELFTGGEELCAAGDTWIDPVLLCAPKSDSVLEASIRTEQGTRRTAFHHSEEASSPSHFHYPRAETEAFLACVQLEPQPNLPTYEAQLRGTGGHVIPHGIQNCGSGGTNRRAQTVCADCKRGFGRAQELARHRKDVHEQPRHCLFCGFKWTRPSKIKAHILVRHREKFTAKLLVTIQALRGRMIVAFLDWYDQGSGAVEVEFHSPIPKFPDFFHSNVLQVLSSHSERLTWGAPAP